MITFKNPYLFIATFAISTAIVVLLHMLFPKLYSKNYRYRHSLVSVASKRLAPKRTRFRIVTLALKIALVALISLALAEPYIVTQKQIYVESKEVSELSFNVRPPLIIILDTSGSMSGTKIETAKRVIVDVVERLPQSIDVGFIEFAERVKQAVAPTGDRSKVVEAIERAEANGGTMYSYPLRSALNWLKPYREYNVSASVVFVSDGLPADINDYRPLLDDFKRLGIPIYTVFIGFEQEGIKEMRFIANSTGGEPYIAETVDKLPKALGKALEQASQAIQRVEVSAKVVKTIDVYTPLLPPILVAALALYIVYRVVIHRFSGVTF
ncbi:MAG: vWA domain-containing protein [Ignisphaera sp.]